MKNLKYYFVFILLITLSSCNQNGTEIEESLITGFYKIETMSSDKLVDLNGDTQKSYDLKSEINDYFNDLAYDLEIRPNYTNDTKTKLISLYFPEPYLTYEYPSHPNGFVEYGKSGVGFTYEFKDNRFLLDGSNNEFVSIDKIELLENGKISSMISKDYYDFSIQNWTNLKIEIMYSKME
jgi:hypothetical protein